MLSQEKHNLSCASSYLETCRWFPPGNQEAWHLLTRPPHYVVCTKNNANSFRSAVSAAPCRSSATTGGCMLPTETRCSGCSSTPARCTARSCGSAKGSWTKPVQVNMCERASDEAAVGGCSVTKRLAKTEAQMFFSVMNDVLTSLEGAAVFLLFVYFFLFCK